jgi:hypothetical protein
MSDVLHHARLTPTLSGIAIKRAGFLARINQRAEKLRIPPKPAPIFVITNYGILYGPPKPAPHRIRVADVQRHVARKYGLEKDDLMCGRRLRPIVRVRQIAVWVAYAVTKRSQPELGRSFGYTDHTSVTHALKKLNRLRLEDPLIDAELIELLAECSAL